jgi:hypothetical protein
MLDEGYGCVLRMGWTFTSKKQGGKVVPVDYALHRHTEVMASRMIEARGTVRGKGNGRKWRNGLGFERR